MGQTAENVNEAADFVTIITSVEGKRMVKRINEAGGIDPYDRGAKWFSSVKVPVNNLDDLARVLDDIGPRSAIIHGELIDGVDPNCHRRRKNEKNGVPPAYREAAHYYLVIDLDVPGDVRKDWFHALDWDPQLPAEVIELIPPELHGVRCHWRATASTGVKDGIYLRMFYWLDKALTGAQKEEWLKNYRIDRSVFRTVQPVYVGAPVFDEGVEDPLKWFCRRSGFKDGFRPVVPVPDIVVPERVHQDAPEGLTEDDNDPTLISAAKHIIERYIKAKGAGTCNLGGSSWAIANLLADIRTDEDKMLSDAGIAALMEEHCDWVDDADNLADLVERAGEGRDDPRGYKLVGEDGRERLSAHCPLPPANDGVPSNVFGREFFPGTEIPPMKTIVLHSDYLSYAVEDTVKEMVSQRVGFFRRGGAIVRPQTTQIDVRGGRSVSGDRLVSVSTSQLRHELSKVIQFQKPGRDAARSKWHCPADLAQTILEWPDRWPLPFLTGITTAPTLRPDGTILDTAGYDEATGILYQPNANFPTIPDEPTKDQAYAALQMLKRIVATFPFETDADRSVWLSAVLTGATRITLPTAPLHMFNAPVAGSGKGMLADCAAIIATGREASAMVQADEAETEKRLGAMLMAGDPAILIDNVTRPVLGDFLCSLLTREYVKPRKLGVSEAPELMTNVLMLATGNNIRTYGDMSRRALRCTIDPRVEEPRNGCSAITRWPTHTRTARRC